MNALDRNIVHCRVWKGWFGSEQHSQRGTFKSIDDFNRQHPARFGMARDSLYARLFSPLGRQTRTLEFVLGRAMDFRRK